MGPKVLSCLAALSAMLLCGIEHEACATATVTLEEQPTTLTTEQIPRLKISIDSGPNPWNNLNLNNNPRNFQFAIVTDRTGGLRPGIFEDAADKLNILQPEFVMSVGDFIPGYTADKNLLKREWDEFQAAVGKLTMPFFYVPGNHDLANPIEHKEWEKRFGRKYFHFVYGDVLFLCLNSEDPNPGIGREQLEYFREALAQNTNVRWTLVFLHRPLWVMNTKPAKFDDTMDKVEKYSEGLGWEEFESLLKGRKHTVYAGHLHNYVKYDRNDMKYFILATTGGGSQMRGAWGYGEFDHVAWITMTDAGPIMANLELSGIWDENVRTEETAHIVRSVLSRGVRGHVVVAEPFPFTSATLNARLQNDSDHPLKLKLVAPQGTALKIAPQELELTVPPNSVEFRTFELNGESVSSEQQLAALSIHWTGRYELPGKRPIIIDGGLPVTVDAARRIQTASKTITADGKLADWPEKLSEPQRFVQTIGAKKAWSGWKDCSFAMASCHDDENLYVAMKVTDDSIVPPAAASEDAPAGDTIELWVDPSGESDEVTSVSRTVAPKTRRQISRPRGAADPKGIVRVRVSPPDSDAAAGGLPPTIIGEKTDKITASCAAAPGGYAAEFAIPLALLKESQGGSDWDSARINVTIHDRDAATGPAKSVLWWRPDWAGPENYANSGLFLRDEKE